MGGPGQPAAGLQLRDPYGPSQAEPHLLSVGREPGRPPGVTARQAERTAARAAPPQRARGNGPRGREAVPRACAPAHKSPAGQRGAACSRSLETRPPSAALMAFAPVRERPSMRGAGGKGGRRRKKGRGRARRRHVTSHVGGGVSAGRERGAEEIGRESGC